MEIQKEKQLELERAQSKHSVNDGYESRSKKSHFLCTSLAEMCLRGLPQFEMTGLTDPACICFAVPGRIPEWLTTKVSGEYSNLEKMPWDVQMASPAELTEMSIFSIF